MEEITAAEVRRIAELARLGLDADEEAQLASQLERIVEAMASLRQVDTAGVQPLFHVWPDLANVTRPDEPKPVSDGGPILDAAPDRNGPFLRVPRVID